ncbi:MAG: hypothetical protein KDI01_05420, partial [Halioglobus sp.]|nr:hypothetical protein [Halioglobus sp.]
MEVALQQSVQLLKSARAPLFAGLATDVNGMRATLELADRCGGVLDHLNGDAMFRNIRVVQDNGWVACTLSEARNRADLILIIGTQCFDRFPRFVDRVLLPRESLFSPKAGRHLVMLGPWQNNRLPATLKDYAPITLHAHPSQWADVAGMLRARLGNRPVDSGRLGGQLAEGVEELARLLREAKYSVITWSAAELTFPHAELVIERWAALARDLNQTTRSSVLPLAGNQGDITSNQVCTWQTGYPLRTSLQYGYPVHDSR